MRRFIPLHAAALIGLTLGGLPLAAQTAKPFLLSGQHRHQRLLLLEGGQNFRDLGGYRTNDGRTVRWGLLFRSGSMHFLTPADYDKLEKLGIRTVCDFRSTQERATEPAIWPAGNPPRVLADDYEMNKMIAGSTHLAAAPTAAQARAAMAATYPQLLRSFNSQYRRMFGELLAKHVPLAFNCTAGKDRTGVAAALILTALGVPRQVVIQDYLLTNRYFDPVKVVHRDDQVSTQWSKLPPDVLKAYMSADPTYIEAVFATMSAHHGGVQGYLRDELGLSPVEILKLRQLYTEHS